MTDRLIKITTALAVVAVAVVAAVISYQHAYELVRSHGESGLTARLLPFTVDGLIWAASMVVLDASRRGQPVPRLAAWSLGTGIVATVAPTWHTASATARSARWSAPGPRWRWLAHLSFLTRSTRCRVTLRWHDTWLVVRHMSVRVVVVAGSCLRVAWHEFGGMGAGVPGEAAVWCAVLDGAR